MIKLQNIGRHTRAGKDGALIVCPVCEGQTRVYHFAWDGIVCHHCDNAIDKVQWKKVVYRE